MIIFGLNDMEIRFSYSMGSLKAKSDLCVRLNLNNIFFKRDEFNIYVSVDQFKNRDDLEQIIEMTSPKIKYGYQKIVTPKDRINLEKGFDYKLFDSIDFRIFMQRLEISSATLLDNYYFQKPKLPEACVLKK